LHGVASGLGSRVRGLRVATSFANRIRNWEILGSLEVG
jgi:hypothetical protein